MTLPVVILAGGLATRLGARSLHQPKSLMDVAGKPFAVRQLELLEAAGVKHVVFCLGHLGHMVQDSLGSGSRWGMRLDFVHDGPVLQGTGGALRNALPKVGDRFLVLYGDSYLRCDYQQISGLFEASPHSGMMTVFRNEGRWDQSNVKFLEGRILAYDKRNPSPSMRHIDYGLGGLARDVLVRPAFSNSCVDLAEIYRTLIVQNDLLAIEVSDRFFEIGSPEGLEETCAFFRDR